MLNRKILFFIVCAIMAFTISVFSGCTAGSDDVKITSDEGSADTGEKETDGSEDANMESGLSDKDDKEKAESDKDEDMSMLLIDSEDESKSDVVKAEYKVARGTFEKREGAIGEVKYTDLEYETADVSFEAKVVDIKVGVGDKVKKGDVLLTLEPFVDNIEITRRTVEVERMEKEYAAGLDSRKAEITMAEKELAKISESNKRKIKEIEIKKLKLGLEAYKETKKTVDEERELLDNLTNGSKTTKVRAKHDGYILDMYGLKEDDTRSNGQTIAVVSQKKEYYIEAEDINNDNVRYGDIVDVVVEGREGRKNVTFKGKVISASNILNPRSNQYTALIRIEDQNKVSGETDDAEDGETPDFNIEDPIKVYYQTAYAENVLLIPIKAVQYEEDGSGQEKVPYVFIKSGDNIVKQFINIIDSNKDYVRVEDGVNEGDTLIVYSHS